MLSEREGTCGPQRQIEVSLPKKGKWMLNLKEQTDVQYIPIVVMGVLKISDSSFVYVLNGQSFFQ